jgi:hypothetical protein
VPAGLWAALIARDGGCAWPGCDAPPAWCQAAHGNTPYRHDGKLKLADAALLCLRHHRRFDHDGWTLHIEGTTVTFHPTNRTDQTDPTGRTNQADRPGRPSDGTDGHDPPGDHHRADGNHPPGDRRRAGQPDRPPDDADGRDPGGDPDRALRDRAPPPPPGVRSVSDVAPCAWPARSRW